MVVLAVFFDGWPVTTLWESYDTPTSAWKAPAGEPRGVSFRVIEALSLSLILLFALMMSHTAPHPWI